MVLLTFYTHGGCCLSAESASEEGSWVCFWSTDESRENRCGLVGPQRFRSYLGITKLACGPSQAAFIAGMPRDNPKRTANMLSPKVKRKAARMPTVAVA